MGTFGLALPAEPLPLPPAFTFQDFYQRHSALAYRAALRVTGNAADAEDVLQTVFMRILNLQPPPILETVSESYLRRAATNAAIDILRQKSSRGELPLEGGPDREGPANTALLKEQVRRALGRLDPEDAQLFVLRNIDGFSYDELADQFAIERGTVASRLHRIRQALLKLITR
jgi:RNA polymerase sigma-70 factor, ECF subfamily